MTPTPLEELISRLEKLEKEATPGPYFIERVDHDDEITYEVHSLVKDEDGERNAFHVVFREGNCLDHGVSAKKQAELYATSKNSLPTLLKIIKVQQEVLELIKNGEPCHKYTAKVALSQVNQLASEVKG